MPRLDAADAGQRRPAELAARLLRRHAQRHRAVRSHRDAADTRLLRDLGDPVRRDARRRGLLRDGLRGRCLGGRLHGRHRGGGHRRGRELWARTGRNARERRRRGQERDADQRSDHAEKDSRRGPAVSRTLSQSGH
ncbi:hypothetical protein [Aeromicrobium sp. UC242_57]|uniref:hypothetical protein n=1 Tax=Aeromicrobium sp. UC242_57 TaxID=3374624 RepID=UPI0037AC7EE2